MYVTSKLRPFATNFENSTANISSKYTTVDQKIEKYDVNFNNGGMKYNLPNVWKTAEEAVAAIEKFNNGRGAPVVA